MLKARDSCEAKIILAPEDIVHVQRRRPERELQFYLSSVIYKEHVNINVDFQLTYHIRLN